MAAHTGRGQWHTASRVTDRFGGKRAFGRNKRERIGNSRSLHSRVLRVPKTQPPHRTSGPDWITAGRWDLPLVGQLTAHTGRASGTQREVVRRCHPAGILREGMATKNTKRLGLGLVVDEPSGQSWKDEKGRNHESDEFDESDCGRLWMHVDEVPVARIWKRFCDANSGWVGYTFSP